MKPHAWIGTIAVGVALLGASPAAACGDKFVRLGRGGRFQRGHVAAHPAAILIYAGAPSAADRVNTDRLRQSLTSAGHTTVEASDPAELAAAMKKRRFDVILVGKAERADLDAALGTLGPRPPVIPLALQAQPGSGKDGSASTSTERYGLLATIDKELGQRRR